MKSKYIKLLISIVLDLVGMATYFIPELGEIIDVVWAPLSAYLLVKLYKNKVSKYAAAVGFVEEILPFTDFVPTFTITWVISYVSDRKN